MDHIPTDRLAIPIEAEGVKIINSPAEFYETLLEKIRGAKNRIYLSSLYLGDGKLENDLIDSISARLDDQKDLDVTVLFDFLRGSRGEKQGKSSTTLLKRIAARAKVYLYHTPALRGHLKSLLSERTNEIIGLQHMKLYVFDDAVLISGANLSDSYFTNRQDRYVLIEKTPELANFFCSVINAVGSCSFILHPDGNTSLHENAPHHPFLGDNSSYSSALRDRVLAVIGDARASSSLSQTSSDTVVVPILQMGPIGIDDEHYFLKKLFAAKDECMEMTVASGYLNATQEYEELMLGEGKYSLTVLMAAPEANGFAGATGLSRFVPSMYTSIARNFYDSILLHKREKVELREWRRTGWTFHAKGIWCDYGNRMDTVVGSSNYGFRSLERDLEAQVVLSTTNGELIQRLREERNSLMGFSSVVDGAILRRADHHVPSIVAFLSKFIRNFF